MKATGVVRRIDELGRIVIPKEIRKTLKIREGENLEIFTDDNENIILKKFSPMYKLGDYAEKYIEAISYTVPYNILVTDRDKIIAAAGPLKKKYIGQNISDYLEKIMERRENVLENSPKEVYFISEELENASYIIHNIAVDGDIVGLIIIFTPTDKITEIDEKIVKIASNYFINQLKH